MVVERVAAAIVRDERILLVTGGQGFFVAPGGRIEPGESPEAALKRELYEELAVKVASMRSYADYKTIDETTGGELLVHCYLVDFDGEPTPSGEVREAIWFSRQNFLDGSPRISMGVYKQLIPRLMQDGLWENDQLFGHKGPQES